MEKKFELGQVVCTRGIADRTCEDEDFDIFISNCLRRHVSCDWGDMDDEDKRTNDEAVRIGERVFAAYIYPETKEKIWIITERDRSTTTILFPEEY